MAERVLRTRTASRPWTRWRGAGILRIAPADAPGRCGSSGTSRSRTTRRTGCARQLGVRRLYVINLETAHQRAGHDTFTGDHVLDLWIEADGTINVKDADELEAAVEQGRVTAGRPGPIRLNGEHGQASFARGDWPFDDELDAAAAGPRVDLGAWSASRRALGHRPRPTDPASRARAPCVVSTTRSAHAGCLSARTVPPRGVVSAGRPPAS